MLFQECVAGMVTHNGGRPYFPDTHSMTLDNILFTTIILCMITDGPVVLFFVD